jgi:hypothetical protein
MSLAEPIKTEAVDLETTHRSIGYLNGVTDAAKCVVDMMREDQAMREEAQEMKRRAGSEELK